MKRTKAPATGRPRQHREDPKRSGPLRDWSNLYRPPDATNSEERAAAQDTQRAGYAGAVDEVVAHGVELGYRVIDEHVRQGQRAASRFNRRAYESARRSRYGPEAAADDLKELVERLLSYSASLVPQWLEAANGLAAAPELLRELLRQWEAHPRNGARSTNGAHTGAERSSADEAAAGAERDGGSDRDSAAVAIEVVSSRPARVRLDLRARHSGRLALAAGGLRALDHGRPALGDVAFVAGENGDGPTMRIRVPDEQPADLYTGVVIDTVSGEPCGTLSVRVAAG
jgi:hypothetical protein